MTELTIDNARADAESLRNRIEDAIGEAEAWIGNTDKVAYFQQRADRMREELDELETEIDEWDRRHYEPEE